MKNRKILLIAALTIFVTAVVFFVISKGNSKLISPAVKQDVRSAVNSSPLPSAPSNQPKEIKYNGATDLQKELDSINPRVLDEDFGT